MAQRQHRYFNSNKNAENPTAIRKEEIQQHPDNKIDSDFPGFPHGQSKENIIQPETENDKKTAAVGTTDGEKKLKNNEAVDESDSDGSGGAFEDAEEVKE